MDFFEKQEQARRNTKQLVVYFAAAVVLIIAAVYAACLILLHTTTAQSHLIDQPMGIALWNPGLFLCAAAGTLAVIAGGSIHKTSELAAGGSALARTLGGRMIAPDAADPDERKLLNVVEEMSIASGVPVPQVFVLDGEQGINAFAAGHSISDAVIAVTRGCATLLTRDELQGVVGHEFSHILNGDMRLNMRLISTIFGILCLSSIGRILMRTRGKKNPLPLLGLALMLIGAIGVFFGRLIQAAVSRQREFLADASSVQFTRNPGGLSGALRKIGGFAFGSSMRSDRAADACHIFFSNALTESLLNMPSLFATHPPLQERIRAIDPTWQGDFLKAGIAPAVRTEAPASPGPRVQSAAAGLAQPAIEPQAALADIGQATPLHLRYAQQLRDSFPESVRSAAREPLSASALVCAMLLSRDEALRCAQLRQLSALASPAVAEKTEALWPQAAPIAARSRLPLASLVLPALRGLQPQEYARFVSALRWLMESDRKLDLFEYVLQKIIRRHLEPNFAPVRSPSAQFHAIKPLLPDCAVLLSAMARIGQQNPEEIERAFRKGTSLLRTADEGSISLVPRERCGLAHIDPALNRLALASPQIKKSVLEACAHTAAADGTLHESEAELLRAVADALDCPIPPFVPQQ